MKLDDAYVEKVYAGWLGKLIGVRYGAPVEMWTPEQISERYAGKQGYLEDYRDFAADDDTNGPIFFFRGFADSGFKEDSETFGKAWLNYAPYLHGFYWWGGYGVSTEHTAYENMLAGIMPPDSGSARQNGKIMAEQIGGQIFSDIWGLIRPDDVAAAAELAEKASRVSHDLDGVNGGRFVAAMVSAAFTAQSVGEILDRALTVVPEDCLYARTVRDVRDYCKGHSAEESFRYVRSVYNKETYPGNCHIIPNAAIMIYGLVKGGGDFDETLRLTNFAGFDTDCNVGNLGTVMGVFHGLEKLDYAKWRAAVNDVTVCSSVVGYRNIVDAASFSRELADCARKHYETEYSGKYPFRPGLVCDFALPGSTHGIRTTGGEGRNAGGVYEAVSAGGECCAVRKVYYGKDDLSDNRYDPCVSPQVVPGMYIRAVTDGPARVFYTDYLSGKTVYGREGTGEIFLSVTDRGAFVHEIGVSFTGGRRTISLLEAAGEPDFIFDFSRQKTEDYSLEHKEVSGCAYHKGIWALEAGALSGRSCAGGALFTGVPMRDGTIACPVTLIKGGSAGICIRVQGAARRYGAVLDGKTLSLIKNDYGERTLAKTDFPCAEGQRTTVRLTAVGNRLTAEADGVSVTYTDPDPIDSGVIGATVCKGAAGFEKFDVQSIYKKED